MIGPSASRSVHRPLQPKFKLTFAQLISAASLCPGTTQVINVFPFRHSRLAHQAGLRRAKPFRRPSLEKARISSKCVSPTGHNDSHTGPPPPLDPGLADLEAHVCGLMASYRHGNAPEVASFRVARSTICASQGEGSEIWQFW